MIVSGMDRLSARFAGSLHTGTAFALAEGRDVGPTTWKVNPLFGEQAQKS